MNQVIIYPMLELKFAVDPSIKWGSSILRGNIFSPPTKIWFNEMHGAKVIAF
jgi:hypothetical protein